MLREFFNQRAPTWDERVSEKDKAKLESMANRLGLRNGATVLDVGTGTGVLLPYILERVGRDGRVIALDFAIEMLRLAKSKAFAGDLHFLCAEAGHLPLGEGSIDHVVCYSSLPHFPDKPLVLTECRRVLRRGGAIAIGHTASRPAINAIHARIPMVSNHFLPDAPLMGQLLADAGFAEIVVDDTEDSYLAMARKA